MESATLSSSPDSSGNRYWASFSTSTFAKGHTYNVHKGLLNGHGPRSGDKTIVKSFRNEAGTEQKCEIEIFKSEKAFELAGLFNKKMTDGRIEFVKPRKALMDDVSRTPLVVFSKKKRRLSHLEWVLLQEYFGKRFQTFVNCHGESTGHICQTLQAFVHFTHFTTSGQLVVCCLKGDEDEHGWRLTTPTIHSVNKSYGDSDLGCKGIQLVFGNHQCNEICQRMMLPNNEPLNNIHGRTMLPNHEPLNNIHGCTMLPNHEPLNNMHGCTMLPNHEPLNNIHGCMMLPAYEPLNNTHGCTFPTNAPMNNTQYGSLPTNEPMNNIHGCMMLPAHEPMNNAHGCMMLPHSSPMNTRHDGMMLPIHEPLNVIHGGATLPTKEPLNTRSETSPIMIIPRKASAPYDPDVFLAESPAGFAASRVFYPSLPSYSDACKTPPMSCKKHFPYSV